MTVKRKGLPYDPADPPAGVRLNLGGVAGRLGITISDMAEAAQISRTAIARLLSNEWPARTDRALVKASIEQLFIERHVSDDDLAKLFHAHMSVGALKAFVSPPTTRERAAAAASPPTPTEEDDTHMLPAKQTLTRAARQAFGIFRNPFDSELMEDDEIFVNAELAYVREACLQAAFNASFVAVVGQSGAGKTTLVEHVEETIEQDRRQIIVIRPSVLGMEERESQGTPVKANDILAAIVTALDPRATPKQTTQARTTQALQLLTASAEAGNKHLLLVEEAHSMSDFTLKHLKRLHEAKKVGRRPVLGILLVGQTELKHRLRPGYAPLREVVQRCEVVELLPLDNDLKAYLAHLAKQAGADLAKLIDDMAIEELRARLRDDLGTSSSGKRRQASQLYPLAVNNLMTACLNQAAELGVPIVNRDVVRAA